MYRLWRPWLVGRRRAWARTPTRLSARPGSTMSDTPLRCFWV